MFGPDLCGYDVSRIHLIFEHNGENLLKEDEIKLDYADKDEFTHLYTLVLEKDGSSRMRPRRPACLIPRGRNRGRARHRWLLVPPRTRRAPETLELQICLRLRPPRLSEVRKTVYYSPPPRRWLGPTPSPRPTRRRPGVAPSRRTPSPRRTRIKPQSLGARLRRERAHELGLLVGRLEAAVAELGRRVDELEVDLLHLHPREVRV